MYKYHMYWIQPLKMYTHCVLNLPVFTNPANSRGLMHLEFTSSHFSGLELLHSAPHRIRPQAPTALSSNHKLAPSPVKSIVGWLHL